MFEIRAVAEPNLQSKCSTPLLGMSFTMRPQANAALSELVRVVLSIGHGVAFETASQTLLVGSRCRNFEIRARSVLVPVPILKWWCFGAVFGRGCAAAVLEAPSCVLRVRLSIDNCVVFERCSERFRCARIVETLRFGRLSTVR